MKKYTLSVLMEKPDHRLRALAKKCYLRQFELLSVMAKIRYNGLEVPVGLSMQIDAMHTKYAARYAFVNRVLEYRKKNPALLEGIWNQFKYRL